MIEPVEQCQCRGDEESGLHGTFWCKYHECRKTQHWRELCRDNEGFRIAWNCGLGPSQVRPTKSGEAVPVDGLGDHVAHWLAKVGVTEENYKAVKAMFGLPPTCGCAGRREWLNRVGRWLTENRG